MANAGRARADDGEDIRVGSVAAAGAGGSPFGSHPDPEYGAAADPPDDPGSAPRPGRRAPVGAARASAYGPEEPALGVTQHLDEGPAPWADLTPETPETPETLTNPRGPP